MKGIIFIDIDECVSSILSTGGSRRPATIPFGWQQTLRLAFTRKIWLTKTRYLSYFYSRVAPIASVPLDKFHPSVKINKNLLHRLWNVATNRNHTKHIPEFVFLSREERKKRIAKEDALCVHRLLYFFNGAANQDEVGGDVIT